MSYRAIGTLLLSLLLVLSPNAFAVIENTSDSTLDKFIPIDIKPLPNTYINNQNNPTPPVKPEGNLFPDRPAPPTEGKTFLERKVKAEDRDIGALNIVHLYKPNYFLPYYYTVSPDSNSYPQYQKNGKSLNNTESKAQVSFLVPVWTNLFGQPNFSIGGAYTQFIYWQIYQELAYSYVREINYQPSGYIRYLINSNYLVSINYEHQSNGLGGEEERLINKITGQIKYSNGPVILDLSGWYILAPFTTTDLDRYHGFSSLSVAYQFFNLVITGRIQNAFESKFSRGQFTASISMPLFDKKNTLLYAEYFNGYGQSITEYNNFTQSFGVGVSLNDVIP